MTSHKHLSMTFRRLSAMASVLVSFVGLLVLVGWIFDIAFLKSVLPGLVTMKANTALCFILSGASLFILRVEWKSQRVFYAGYACAIAVILTGGLTLTEYITGLNLRIDELFFTDELNAVSTFTPGRMAVATALSFFLLGFALMLFGVRRAFGLMQGLIFVSLSISLLALLGYLHSADSLYRIFPYTPVALHTAVTFTLLSLGILWARTDQGFMAIVTSESLAGVMLRRLLPAAFLLPIVTGWMQLVGQQAGYYNAEFALTLFSLMNIFIFTGLAWLTARIVYRLDTKRISAEESLRQAHSDLEIRVRERTVELEASNKRLLAEIAERNQVEEALRKNEESLRQTKQDAEKRLEEIEQIYKYAPVGLFSFDRNYRFVRINERMAEINGFAVEEHIGKSMWEVVPDLADRLVEIYRPVYERGEPVVEVELHGRTPKSPDTDRDWLASYFPFKSETGEVIGLIGAVLEITERRRTETALRSSQARFAGILDIADDAIISVDTSQRITLFNQGAEKIFGYTHEEVIGQPLDMLMPIRFAETHRQHLVELGDSPNISRRRGERLQIFGRRKDGGEFPAEASISKLDLEGEKIFTVILRDVTDRNRSEEALIESEERFRSAFEHAPIGMALMGLDGRFLKVNASLLEIVGYSEEELLDLNFQVITHPDDLEADLAYLDQLIAGKIRSYQIEKRYIHKFGHEVWALLNGSLVHDAYGKPIYGIEQIQDIAERKRTRDQIEQSLKEKEVLLKEIHHRVKNNLQIIHSLFNLQSNHIEDRRAIDMLRESQNRVYSMALVHEHLYQSKDLASIDFARYVKTLSEDLLHSYESDTGRFSLETKVADNVIFGIDTAIPCGLIISELVSNALKHGFPNGRTGHLKVRLGVDVEGLAILIVKDDGVGFPQNLDFRNTTSLGLQLVNILIAQLGGSIEMNNESGTTFRMTFPTGQ